MPEDGSDFVTAPELSPVFGQVLAAQVREALDATGTQEVWELAPAAARWPSKFWRAGRSLRRYTIVDLSGDLRARQQERLAPWGDKVPGPSACPPIEGVVVGNEVLDAMPVQLLQRTDDIWHERGVGWTGGWRLRLGTGPPICAARTESKAARLPDRDPRAGEAFIHPGCARWCAAPPPHRLRLWRETSTTTPAPMGTVMCHRAHRADDDPLADVGQKDITAHVNFTAMAVAAQDAGLHVLGYTSQARFWLNCGLLQKWSCDALDSVRHSPN